MSSYIIFIFVYPTLSSRIGTTVALCSVGHLVPSHRLHLCFVVCTCTMQLALSGYCPVMVGVSRPVNWIYRLWRHCTQLAVVDWNWELHIGLLQLHYCNMVDNYSTNFGSRYSNGGLLAIKDFAFFFTFHSLCHYKFKVSYFSYIRRFFLQFLTYLCLAWHLRRTCDWESNQLTTSRLPRKRVC